MAPHNSTLIDENLSGFPSSQELRHYSPIPHPGCRLNRRPRSISIHGSLSTLEQGNKEIPIWIDNEPRYVAGVTSRTTCNDIIKAMIDDEVNSGNNAYSRDGDVKSRDYSDYVITEYWRGVERSYDGNMAILPVWKAWSRVHNEIRLSLKRHSEVVIHPKKKRSSSRALTSIRKYFNKLLKLLTRKKMTPAAVDKNEIRPSEAKTFDNKFNCQHVENKSDVDEFLFVILPDKQYDNQTVCKPVTEEQRMKERLYRLSEKPKKKRHPFTRQRTPTKIAKSTDRNRRRKDMPIRSLLRNQIALKTSEIDELFNRESRLLKELSAKCRQYKLRNELYTNPDQQFEISIGEIQNSIEAYAEEILKTEKELLEIKNEIKHDMSIINNLKRMTFRDPKEVVKRRTPSTWNAPVVMNEEEFLEHHKQMQFVDNIYEFCDNNASMLV